ncbi:hypothetical protein PsorP6_000061 [Peronosclerospora sorghi]|uniref:Uncharacterized protein n=1 Tax=Peronosclerospora sorghi TaxID=230839 RepID=A0ACC0WQF1_9STRA|nr:hypothetical protein PsorP6_000061 [Peronosclerospora sorghi]
MPCPLCRAFCSYAEREVDNRCKEAGEISLGFLEQVRNDNWWTNRKTRHCLILSFSASVCNVLPSLISSARIP